MQGVFISYRRETGGPWALALFQRLTNRRVDAYYDIESGQALGQFDTRILNQIAARPFFVLVLTPGTLERCREPGDWLWREMDHALRTDRIIVPMLTPGFTFADADRFLPADAAARLRSFNGIELSQTWFTEAVERLVVALQEPVSVDVGPVSAEDEEQAQAAVERAAIAPIVTAGDLAAFERLASLTPDDVRGVISTGPRPADPAAESDRRGPRIAIFAGLAAAVALIVLAVTLLVADGRDDDETVGGTSSTLGDGTVLRILMNRDLAVGKSLTSPNGSYRVQMTARGALVLLSGSDEIWNSDAEYDAAPGAIGWMGDDGNFVVYSNSSLTTQLWDSQTGGNRGASLILGDDGVVAVVLGDQRWPFIPPDESDTQGEGDNESTDTPNTVATTPFTTVSDPPTTPTVSSSPTRVSA